MRVQECEAGRAQKRAAQAQAAARRRVERAGRARAAERRDGEGGEVRGPGAREDPFEAGHGLRRARDARHARHAERHQQRVRRRAERDDRAHVLAPQALAEHEGVLRADRHDQSGGQRETGGEGGDVDHGAPFAPEFRYSPTRFPNRN